MKQLPISHYARAIAELAQQPMDSAAEQALADRISRWLLAQGIASKANQILEEAWLLLLKRQGKRSLVVDTARQPTQRQRDMIKRYVRPGDVVVERIKPELVAGMRLTVNGEWQFDASLQKKLETMFKGF